MMSDERATYLESGAGVDPMGKDRLDRVRGLLARAEMWAEPPHEVAENVLADIAASTAGPAPVGLTGIVRWAIGGIATAAAIALVLAFGLTGSSGTVLAMDGTELAAAASGEALVRVADSGWVIRLEVEGLPATGPDEYYEGWLWSDDGEGVSVGTFRHSDGDEPVTLWSGVDPAAYPSLWVTLETEDGDPAASERVVMRGRAPID
jgi:anti-sigma-K factor RskA